MPALHVKTITKTLGEHLTRTVRVNGLPLISKLNDLSMLPDEVTGAIGTEWCT